MYSRSFGEQDPSLTIPESYSGTALTEPEDEQLTENSSEQSREGIGAMAKQALKGLGLGLPKVGLEELIIIGAAALMLFSKERDMECGLLLLALLFIT